MTSTTLQNSYADCHHCHQLTVSLQSAYSQLTVGYGQLWPTAGAETWRLPACTVRHNQAVCSGCCHCQKQLGFLSMCNRQHLDVSHPAVTRGAKQTLHAPHLLSSTQAVTSTPKVGHHIAVTANTPGEVETAHTTTA